MPDRTEPGGPAGDAAPDGQAGYPPGTTHRSGDHLDRITLRGLRARGSHGALPEERSLGQTFVVDVQLGVDTRPAAATDDLARTVHYGDVAEEVAEVVTGGPYALIETLAERIAEQCLTHSVVQEVKVTVHKPQAPITVPFDDVTITIQRSRS